MPNSSADNIAGPAGHGAGTAPAVHVDACNAELRHAEGFIGDCAGKRAFFAVLAENRSQAHTMGDEDPLSEQLNDKDRQEGT